MSHLSIVVRYEEQKVVAWLPVGLVYIRLGP